ncbi:hypothetical protein IWX47DRAFT_622766 [Phyllosticta citricarpa]
MWGKPTYVPLHMDTSTTSLPLPPVPWTGPTTVSYQRSARVLHSLRRVGRVFVLLSGPLTLLVVEVTRAKNNLHLTKSSNAITMRGSTRLLTQLESQGLRRRRCREVSDSRRAIKTNVPYRPHHHRSRPLPFASDEQSNARSLSRRGTGLRSLCRPLCKAPPRRMSLLSFPLFLA